jgi:hypothetical protein
MSLITVIIPDSTVYVDGKAHRVQLPAFPENWQVMQWSDAERRGYVDVRIGDRIIVRERSSIEPMVKLWEAAEKAEAPSLRQRKSGGKKAAGVRVL